MDAAGASAKVTSKGKVMGSTMLNDPILKLFKAALHRLYGDEIERVVLFGTRARGVKHYAMRTTTSRCF